jgi:hypothetical protein
MNAGIKRRGPSGTARATTPLLNVAGAECFCDFQKRRYAPPAAARQNAGALAEAKLEKLRPVSQ